MHVADRHRAALGHSQNREFIESAVVDDGLEVGDPSVEAEVIVHVPVGQTETTFVVAGDCGDLAEVIEEMPPYRA